MEADLERGWRKLQKTYGYFQQTKIPYRGDLTIRAQLAVIAQPAGFAEWASVFPSTEIDEQTGNVSYRVQNRRVVVKIPLSADQSWGMTEQGRPVIYLAEQPLLSLSPGRWFDLRAWVIFHESPARPITDVRVWAENNLVISAGQFESNRRRH